jgi:hypothetical protein
LLEIAPLARIQSSLTSGGPTDLSALAGSFLLLAEVQLEAVLPFDIPSPSTLLPQ